MQRNRAISFGKQSFHPLFWINVFISVSSRSAEVTALIYCSMYAKQDQNSRTTLVQDHGIKIHTRNIKSKIYANFERKKNANCPKRMGRDCYVRINKTPIHFIITSFAAFLVFHACVHSTQPYIYTYIESTLVHWLKVWSFLSNASARLFKAK